MTDSGSMNALLRAFAEIGRRIPLWTQAQGSNLSLKDRGSDLLHIKPSGFRLDQVRSEADLVVLRLSQLSQHMQPLLDGKVTQDRENYYAQAINSSKADVSVPLRPSMETGFHFVLKGEFVFHFHALSAVLIGHEFKKQKDKVEAFFKKQTQRKVSFIDYGTPGLDLTLLLQPQADAEILILKNHGVILNSETAEILKVWSDLEKAFCRQFLGDERFLQASLETLDPNQLIPIPLKILFPDFAIFLQKIRTCLLPRGQEWIFDPALAQKERDLFEIWLSYYLLYRSCPDLEPLAETEIQKICGLPTEQYRLMMK